MPYTFAMIRPHVVESAQGQLATVNILDLVTRRDLAVRAIRHQLLPGYQLDELYAAHVGKEYWPPFRATMADRLAVVMVLGGGSDVIERWRALLGATDPANAGADTIRKLYGASVRENAAHGSDSAEAADREIRMFFPDFWRANIGLPF